MGGELTKQYTQALSQEEVSELYKKVNNDGKWYVSPKSYLLADKIIELWFETQGYDFWNNPYPEVMEVAIKKDNGIEFTYQKYKLLN